MTDIQMEKTDDGALSIAYCHKGLVGDGIVELIFKEKSGDGYGVMVEFYPDHDSMATLMKIQHCLIHIEALRMGRDDAIKVLEDDPIVDAALVDEMNW